MDPVSQPTPPSGDAHDGALDCATTLVLVRRFVSGAEDVAERARMRAHLAACVTCREQYRSEVVLLAQLARGGARGLESVRRMEQRAARRLVGERYSRRVPFARLVLPAVGLYALFAIAGPEKGGPARLASLGGVVLAAGAPLEPAQGAHELERGAACSTDEHARARITRGESGLVLEPESAVIFERSEPFRVRLVYGRLLVEGPVVVTCALGVVSLEQGAAVVDLDAHGLAVTCTRGVARLEDAHGREELAAGAAATRTSPRAAAR
ncbi:MAG: hypothetical protein IPJ77_03685 [Planctomycetes bacterium]|nr:hypothetical protein [Planctomycetota bacterium]